MSPSAEGMAAQRHRSLPTHGTLHVWCAAVEDALSRMRIEAEGRKPEPDATQEAILKQLAQVGTGGKRAVVPSCADVLGLAGQGAAEALDRRHHLPAAI